MSEQQVDANTANQNDTGTVDPGGMLTSFDELEAIDTARTEQVKAQVQEEAVKEEIKEEVSGKKKEATSQEETTEEVSEAEDTKKAASEEETTTEQIEEEAEKLYKALVGEDETEISANAKFNVKVDGEEVEMNLEELISSASGQEAIKKRFGEIGTAKKEFLREKTKWHQEKSFFDSKLKNALQLLNEDPLAGFATFVEMAGMDSGKWLEEFVPKMTDQFSSLADMTEEERDLHKQSVLTQQKEAKLKAREAELASQDQQRAVMTQVQELQAKHDIDDDTFREKFVYLEGLQKKGKLSGEITPQFIADVVVYERTEDKIRGVAEVIRPSLMNDAQSMGDLAEVIMNQDPEGQFSEDDIKDIIIQAFPETSGTEEKLSQKVRKSSKSKEVTKTNKTESAQPQNEPISFDDLY